MPIFPLFSDTSTFFQGVPSFLTMMLINSRLEVLPEDNAIEGWSRFRKEQ